MRRIALPLLAVIAVLLGPGQGRAAPDLNDTRLLAQPAVSARHVAFVYADDLWVADLEGRNVRRLTSDIGLESHPVFAPDGRTIAFSGQYEGNIDVYTIPVEGGQPTRLTWHPGPDIARGWNPDGTAVLFSSPRTVFTGRYQQLFTVPVAGGMPTQLPIPNGVEASYSPDGTKIAYTPLGDVTRQWKHYRGGTNSRIWILKTDNLAVEPIAQRWIAKEGLTDRVRAVRGNFLHDPLPKADVVTMGMILHDWNLEKKQHLIRAACDALPPGGAFIAIENLIDDARRENAFGLLMSLNMLIEFGDAFDFTGQDFWHWCREAGFSRYEVLHLAGPCSAAIAYK